MQANTPAALKILDLYCRYGNNEVLHGVNLSVVSGTICGLLGPNGSGKTTFFKCCLNLHRPDSGDIFVNGKSVLNLSPAKLSRLISYVPQGYSNAFPFSVFDLVRMGRNPHMSAFSGSDKIHKEAAWRALYRIGIQDLAEIPCSSLSGGQRQLVLIARAVAQESPLMLMDEPTSALDFQNQIQVWKILRELAKQGFTILVCSHDPNHILWFCERAVLLKNGDVLATGAPKDIINKETLFQLYGNVCERGKLPNGLPVVYPAAEMR